MKILPFLLATVFLTAANGSVHSQEMGKEIINHKKDPVIQSFVTVGCNRLDKKDTTPSNPSTTNLAQLLQTFKEVLALKPRPKYFFFTGDMVLGYTKDDTALFRRQIRAWANLYKQSGLTEAGVQLVPCMGNHESLYKKPKPASPLNEKIFVEELSQFLPYTNGPKVGGPDATLSDQSQLSFSFNDGKIHYVVLNTDALGLEAKAPLKWLSNDLETSKGFQHCFVFAHKPAYPSPLEDGADAGIEEKDTFWDILESNGAEGFFSAHNHLYYHTQPHTGKTWQIVAGNGGSPLKPKDPTDRFFGYTLVEIHKSGRVIVKSYGRDVPAEGYNSPNINTNTTIRDEFEITRGK